MQCTALACELGIVACTLVQLFNLQHPDNAAREHLNMSEQQSSIGRTFASLAITLIISAFNLVGSTQALAAAQQAVRRVARTRRAARISRASRNAVAHL